MSWVKTAYDEEQMEKIIIKPYDYILEVRVYDFVVTKLSECLNYWLCVPREKLDKIKRITRRINNSIAMFDDILDDSLFRRNQPAAHNVFGIDMALNTSWYAQFLAFEEILQLGHPKAAEVYCKNMLTYLRGSGANIHWRNTQCDVSQEEYNQMIRNQTGGVLSVMWKLMELLSDSEMDLNYFINIFSIYYQMRDEYVNIKKPEAVEEGARIPEWKDLPKLSFCEDFSEGQINTPIVQSLKSRHRDVILGILKMRTRDVNAKKYLLSLLEDAGGIMKTRKLLQELEAEMFAELFEKYKPGNIVIAMAYLQSTVDETQSSQKMRSYVAGVTSQLLKTVENINRLGGNPMLVELIRDLQTWDERA